MANSTKHVIYEPETETIRQTPENYCLMVKRDGRWVMDVDKASTINAHSLRAVFETNPLPTLDGHELAAAIQFAFWGE